MSGILKPDVVGATEESFPLFRCPKCGAVGDIDRDQFEGRVSIVHEVGYPCDYHETKDWRVA